MRYILLLLCCLLLTGCTHDPIAPMAAPEFPALPAPAADALPQGESQAVLWFRFGDEPCLAPEVRTLTSAANDNAALILLRALLEGPGAASGELTGLFPQGTQVISAVQSGRMMFVTLSRHILNPYPDEPADWRDQADWTMEVPLRRQLAMQSIAATVTENCQVDQVVILVDQSATDSLRLRMDYFTLDGSTALAEPLTRDEALLLSPARTAEVILQCWQEADWPRLYLYLARTDPQTGAARPALEDFAARMQREPRLIQACAQGGSVTGDTAVFTLSGAYLNEGAAQPFSGLVLHLTREKGIWRVGLSQLEGREALP